MKPEDALAAALDGLRQLGWKVTKRSGTQAYYVTPRGAEGTLVLTEYASGVWRWHVDHYGVRKRCRNEMAHACLPKSEITCDAAELGAMAAWIPEFCAKRQEAGPEEASRVQMALPVPADVRWSPADGWDYVWTAGATEAYGRAKRGPGQA